MVINIAIGYYNKKAIIFKMMKKIFSAFLLIVIIIISGCQSNYKDISYAELLNLRSTHKIKGPNLAISLHEILKDTINYSKYDSPVLLIISKKMSDKNEICISKTDFNIFKSNRPDAFINLIGYLNFEGIPVLLFGDGNKATIKLENIDFYNVLDKIPEYGRGNPPIIFEPRMKCYNEVDSEQKKIEVNLDQKFIEDNFLKIVDTIAYSRGAFITTPNDSISYPKLSVKLSQKIDYIKELEEYITAYFVKNKDLGIVFKDVINKKSYSIVTLDSNFPKSIGKYYFSFNDNEQNKAIKYAGRIDISNLKIFKDKAMLLLTESIGKYGTTSIVLLVKRDGIWKVYKRNLIITT
jgi:hypothetical protein